MTVYRTVGIGGDHADWSAAWIYLCSIDPLGDDYEFEQISDCTINNTWPDTMVAANRLDLNNHYVKIYCPWANCHQGDPTKGYKTYLNGAAGEIDIRVVSSIVNLHRFYIENLSIEQTTNNGVYIVRVGEEVSGIGNGANFYINNILIKGFSTAAATGLYCFQQDSIYKVSNCKICNIKTGIDITNTSSGGALPADNRVEPNTIENCIVYKTSSATGGIHSRGNTALVRRVEFRNVVSCGHTTNRAWPNYSAAIFANVSNNLYNCADDDGSIAVAIAGGFLNAFDCIGNITLADEFQSLDDTNSNFLKLNDGTYT